MKAVRLLILLAVLVGGLVIGSLNSQPVDIRLAFWALHTTSGLAIIVSLLLGALVGREFKVEGFKDGYSMARYIVGAMAMGFGSMLAGGCAVGAGMTGGAIFALTAWLTLLGMWAGAGLMDRVLAEPVHTAQPATQQAPVVVPVAP